MNASFFISPNTLMIECRIKASGGNTQNQNPFGTEQQLQNRKIIAIETFSQQDISYSPISTSNPVIPANVFNSCFLTLFTSSIFTKDNTGKSVLQRPEGLYYDRMPLPMLRRVSNFYNNPASPQQIITSSGRDLFMIRPTEMSWTKSYITIPNAIAIDQEYSAIFLVHYLDEGDDGSLYRMH